jgi:CHAT domain-containing protein/Tfp pilus assembly protein PilF
MKFNFPPAPMTYSSKVLIVGILLLAGGLSPLVTATEAVIAQTTVAQSSTTDPVTQTQNQSPPKSIDPNRIAAEKAEAEAQKLGQEDAPLATQVIPKQLESLKYWQLTGDRLEVAKTLDYIAKLYWLRGEYAKALEYAQQAASACEALNDRGCQGLAVTSLSLIYKEIGQYQKAIDYFQQLPSLFPDTPEMTTSALTSIGQSYGELGQNQKAFDYYNQALSFWRTRGDVVEQARRLDFIASFYLVNLGENQKAIDSLKQANALDPEYNRKIADLNYDLLSTFSCSDQFATLQKPPSPEPSANVSNSPESASEPATNNIESFQQSVQKYRKQENIRAEAQFLRLLGLEYVRLGQYPQALDTYQQELKLWQFMGAKPEEARVLEDIASILNDQGKKQEAINTLNQSLEIRRQLNILPSEANTLSTLGRIYLSLGAYDSSLDTYQKALSIFRDTGMRSDEITALQDMGSVYKKLKNYPEALKLYQQAFLIAETTGNCLHAAQSKYRISQVYLDTGKDQQAIISSHETLAIAEKIDLIEMKFVTQAKINNVLAKSKMKQENYPEALEYAQKAQSLAQQSQYRTLEAAMFTSLAEVYVALKQPQKAIQTYRDQLALYQALSWQPEKSQTLYDLAKLERKEGDLKAALSSISEAIDIVENIRQEIVNPELKTSFFATKQDYYALKIDILMDLHQQDPTQGYNAQAFDTSERSRARTLLELLNESNADIRQGVDPKLLDQENALKDKTTALEKQWSELINKNPTDQQKAFFQQERKNLLAQYQAIQDTIRAKSPKYAALKYPQPLTLAQVQQQILDPETALLQYSLGEEKSYLWVITKDGFTSHILPVQKEIETTARELLNAIQYGKDDTANISQAANQLSQLVLTPAAKLKQKRLVIVPDGVLSYVPFSTLALNNQPLINQHELVNLPSSSSIALIRQETQNRKPAPKALAILADPIFSADDPRLKTPQKQPISPTNPDLNQLALNRATKTLKKSRAVGNNNQFMRLPGTRQEAQAILALLPKTEIIAAFDEQASLNLAIDPQLSQYRIIHLATHGVFNGEDPAYSGIILSLVDAKGTPINGFLRLNEIFNLNLPAELVVLSACETGLGKEIKGEGLVGLTRGFMYAGSPRVLVSLWQVDDQATAEMMTRFYKLVLEKKLPPVQALREAQLQMQNETEWKSPYYWSAFVLQGEWR